MSEPANDLRSTLPGLLRIAGTAWVRTIDWTLRASVDVARSAVTGDAPSDLLRRTGTDLRDWAREVLGIADSEEEADDEAPAQPEPSDLRERGAELLRRSADVREAEEGHPAYERILDDLSPDEGRILRLLALEGAQPAVDVRSGLPIAAGSQLTAMGLNMIGAQAGSRHLARVPAYLNNLERLGLVWFSRESLEDPLRYQVLESQPEVVDARQRAGRTGRTVRRSIHLTPFGQDFCDAALPLHTAELDALSEPEPPARADAPD
jgi:abortive infection alpha-like protein